MTSEILTRPDLGDVIVDGRGRGVGPFPGRVAHAPVHRSRCPVEAVPSASVMRDEEP